MNAFTITRHLQQNNSQIVVFEAPIKETNAKASFCAQADFFKINGKPVTVWVDGLLNRYVRAGGKMYEASNADLLRMSTREKLVYMDYLTGHID